MIGGVPIDFLLKKFTFDAILIFGCHFEFFLPSCTVDLLQFFKKRSTEIRHLGSRRHFELIQKKFFHDLFVFEG
jgi:hypothetical protein